MPLQANTAHQLAEVHALLGGSQQAAAMRQEVRSKVKDVREVADDNLAKAAGRIAQAPAKVDQLKAALLKQWQDADRQEQRTFQLYPRLIHVQLWGKLTHHEKEIS